RRRPRRLAKGRGERTGFAKANFERDPGDRARGLGQQHLRVLDATGVVVAMGRHAERSLERPAEMVSAQPNGARQGVERYVLGEMFFYIRRRNALLPAGESATCRRLDALRAVVAAHELVRQYDAERLAIMPVFGAALDQPAQFDRRFPQRLVFEERPWRQRRLRTTAHFGGIEIDIHHAAARAGLLRLAVFVTSRHEGELALDVSQRRTR